MAKILKIKVFDLDNKQKDDIDVPSFIFSADIKEEIVAKVVNWQLSKKRQGSHKVKERNEIVGSNAKIYNSPKSLTFPKNRLLLKEGDGSTSLLKQTLFFI